MSLTEIPEPWRSFLKEIDDTLIQPVGIHCNGGFVVTQLWGMTRDTSDIDVLAILTVNTSDNLLDLAGMGSLLYKKYGLYIDMVTVCNFPEDYDTRLTQVFPGIFDKLIIMALDPYDVALTKLERNTQRDRDDVKYLARTVPFDLDILKKRYEEKLAMYLGNEERHDLTLELWMEAAILHLKTYST